MNSDCPGNCLQTIHLKYSIEIRMVDDQSKEIHQKVQYFELNNINSYYSNYQLPYPHIDLREIKNTKKALDSSLPIFLDILFYFILKFSVQFYFLVYLPLLN